MGAAKLVLLVAAAAGAAACNNDRSEQNMAIDINNASPSEIEALPPDESSATPTDQLENGAANADAADLNNSGNSY